METILKNKKLAIFIGIVIMLTAVIGYVAMKKKLDNSINIYAKASEGKKNEVVIPTNAPAVTANLQTPSATMQPNIWVHVTGEVKNPGSVCIQAGSRIKDAIEAAGGTTENADLNGQINLVYELKDGQKILVPSKVKANDLTAADKDDKSQQKKTGNINIEPTRAESTGIISGGTGVTEESSAINASTSKIGTSKVNINAASVSELDTLPGIGKSTAEKIINFRTQNGNFSKIEDIMNVPGIGQARLESLKNMISVK